MDADSEKEFSIPWVAVIWLPTVIALIYALIHLKPNKAKDTTTATTYVSGGKPVFPVRRDEFVRKSVTKVRIQTSSGSNGSRSSGGSRSGGGGGSHRSSGGVRHGGGGRRR